MTRAIGAHTRYSLSSDTKEMVFLIWAQKSKNKQEYTSQTRYTENPG
jgi:hypothetical protein